jgi:hypothetical protein
MMDQSEIAKIHAEHPNLIKLFRACVGDPPSDAPRSKLESAIEALVKEHGLEPVIDGLIQISGLDAVRTSLKSRKKLPGRKNPWPNLRVKDLFVYYAIESERSGTSVNATCERIVRSGRTKLDAGTLRNQYIKGKQLLTTTDPDIRFLIDERIERDGRAHWGRTFAKEHFPRKKLHRNS